MKLGLVFCSRRFVTPMDTVICLGIGDYIIQKAEEGSSGNGGGRIAVGFHYYCFGR